ncbi:hypothetical protein bthur0014_63590 [Bacillus thuringiensis IBL 4222]|nr:hypothetical protein bthur0014_63590 [Bacillus thuringiensis IBL 4222]
MLLIKDNRYATWEKRCFFDKKGMKSGEILPILQKITSF